MRVLRSISRITKIVFVANDPRSSVKNLVDLTRPSSNMFTGEPFMPMIVEPVDLFPHTSHYFTLILFTRVPTQQFHQPNYSDPLSFNQSSMGGMYSQPPQTSQSTASYTPWATGG